MVAHAQHHPRACTRISHLDIGHAGVSVATIAPRVFEQIGQHPAEFGFVGHHSGVNGQFAGDADALRVTELTDRLVHHGGHMNGHQLHLTRARVVHEFVDDGVELFNVGHHVAAGLFVGHAHFRFQPHARQRRAQVM